MSLSLNTVGYIGPAPVLPVWQQLAATRFLLRMGAVPGGIL
jgi:hypothetical protein